MRVSSRQAVEDNSALCTKAKCAVHSRPYYNVITMLIQACQNVLYVNPKSPYVSLAFTADQLLESPHSTDSHTLTHWPTLQQTKCCAAFQHVRHFSLQSPNSPVQDRLPAAVQVVKLLLGDGVVDIHGRHAQLPSFGQLVQPEGQSGNISKRRLLSCRTQAGADL